MSGVDERESGAMSDGESFEFVRPVVSVWRAVLNVGAPILAAGAVCVWNIWAAAVGLLAYIYLRKKDILIWFILLYQAKAPIGVRMRCVFVPTCSEYMILALGRYGFYRGLFKGWRRLKRCHPPNGGFDPLV